MNEHKSADHSLCPHGYTRSLCKQCTPTSNLDLAAKLERAVNECTGLNYGLLHVICNVIDELRLRDETTGECQHCRAVYEIWAGSEGFVPQTAAEAYQERIIHQMREAALGGIRSEKASETAASPWCNNRHPLMTCRKLPGHEGPHSCYSDGRLIEWGAHEKAEVHPAYTLDSEPDAEPTDPQKKFAAQARQLKFGAVKASDEHPCAYPGCTGIISIDAVYCSDHAPWCGKPRDIPR